MPKVSQQHRDARREQILAAARRCFLRDGFHATSMQDLFAEADLSAGAVYSYFASKDDVITAIAEENLQVAADMIQAIAIERPGQPIGAVLADVMDMLQARDAQDGNVRLTVIVWAEALRRGIEVQGFTPTQHDEKQLVRAMAREDAAVRGGVRQEDADVARGATDPASSPHRARWSA